MFRFDAKCGYYFYPELKDSADLTLWMNRGMTYEDNVIPRNDICITKHGLKIPVDALNYEEFVNKMEICEQTFINTISA